MDILMQEEFLRKFKMKGFYTTFMVITHLVTLALAVTFTSLPKKKDQVYLYRNKTFTGGTLQHNDYVTSESACISKCKSLGDSCKSFLISVSKRRYRCQCYSDYPSTILSTEDNTTYGVKSEDQCSGVCNDFGHMNLCGTCSCHDTCANDVLRYYCDCRKEGPVKEDCEAIFRLGFKKNGVFYINPDEKDHFSVSCIMKPKSEKNKEPTCTFVAKQHTKSQLTTLGYVSAREDCVNKVEAQIKSGTKFGGVFYNPVAKHCYGIIGSVTGIYNHDHASSCEFKYTAIPTAPLPSTTPMVLMLLRLQVEDGSFWKRTVKEYKDGFGNSGDNQWIGLENLHRITTTFHTDIQVQMIAKYPVERITTEYKEVKISREIDGYKLSYESFDSLGARGNVWNYDFDRLAVSKGMPFNGCSNFNWWLDCNDAALVPTMHANYFGFATSHERFNSIAFFLVTKERI